MQTNKWGCEEEIETNDPGPTGHGPDICMSDADPGL